MDERMIQIDGYFDGLKARGAKVPRWAKKNSPHFGAVSAASGVALHYLLTEPYKQRIILRAREVGFTPQEGTKTSRYEAQFNLNRASLNNYFRWLEGNAFKLPEDPTHRGKIFFAQVIVEAGLTPKAFSVKKNDREQAYNARLKRMVEEAAASLGVDVRVLPQSPGNQQISFTYGQLFEKGSEERKRQLKDSPSAGAQLSNTRYALNVFLESLCLEETSPIGHEFVAGFKSSVKEVTGRITNKYSRKKFQTEINRWQEIYQQLLKGPSIPDDINQAIIHLVDRSGLSFYLLAKLVGVSSRSLRGWYQESEAPSPLNLEALGRMETLFKIPAGTLVNKLSGVQGKRFRRSQLPPFLRDAPELFYKLNRHLPDNFCTLPLERQEKIVESIRTDILHSDDDYSKRQLILTRLQYQLTEWPCAVREEFDSYADFKTAEHPPLNMKRNGRWKATTKGKNELALAYFFGAICLPSAAEDERLRGLGFPKSQLTLALLVCPALVYWYIKFRCETRTQYTENALVLLRGFLSMLRPKTGWLRQSPHLVGQLHPFACGDTYYVSQDLVSRAQNDWHGVCDEAVKEYEELISNIEPRVGIARDPFHRIEGLLALDDPMESLGILIREMKRDLPNPHTQPVYYHTAVRDLVITLLLVVTGFRRGTIAKLDFTGDETGHLYMEGSQYVLSVPRAFFKNGDSAYFQSNRVKEDYLNRLPDVFGLNEVFKEYLEISRPFLMNRYHSRSCEQPLFVTSGRSGPGRTRPARLSGEMISVIFREKVERHLVENKHRGTGIPKVRRAGPHSVRYVRGTTVYRKTGSFKLAGDANQHSQETARKHYSRTTIEERNQEVNKILF